VGALGHYLEQEGIPTTQISLVREHTVALNPPRALWVPFMLGRPFGAPNDAAFQRKVLLAALRLLERDTGPVLEDFPEDAPHSDLGEAPEGLICPVSFPRMKSEGGLAERLADEISQLRAWHDVAVKHRGRTTLGLTGLSPEELGEFLGSWLTDNPRPSFRQGIASAEALKLSTDELKAFYYEAKAVQPGRHSMTDIQNWFWLETAAGKTFLELRNVAVKSADPTMKILATLSLVPRAVDAALRAGRNL
jgi:hypothetical protein